jgi:hypothetical protein
MAYIPKEAEWFIADLVEEIRIQGSKRNAVHINTLLIRANTPNKAYKKAIKFGKESNIKYINTDGNNVTIRFLGLRNLDVIHDPLKDGCEITYEERIGLTKAGLKKLIKRKEELEAFLPVRPDPRNVPNYASKEIFAKLFKELLKKKK